MTRIIFLRHGESEGNALGVLQGQLDTQLTAEGERQAALTARALRSNGIERVVASPLARARRTAAIVAAELGLPVEEDPDLMEYHFGDGSGHTWQQLRERFREVIESWDRGEPVQFPNEEGRDVFYRRVVRAVERLAGHDGTVLAVAHGGVLGAVAYHVAGLDYARRGAFRFDNCSITELRTGWGGGLALTRHNDVCHLASNVD